MFPSQLTPSMTLSAAGCHMPLDPKFSHSWKEKSRDAARSRRGKENYEFYELAKLLPLPAAITGQLDRASIIRLTISCLRLRDFSGHGDPMWNREGPPPNKSIKGGPSRRRTMTAIAMEMFDQHQGTHILQSLDGFAFALAADGRFLYISETVSIYLGLSQVEMTGSSVFDYIHQQDQAELAEQLGMNLSQGHPLPSPGSVGSDEGSSSTGTDGMPPLMSVSPNSPYQSLERSFCIRMKSTLTKRGVHIKSSGFRVVLILCHLRPQNSYSYNRKIPPSILGMVALAIALPPPSINEVRLESDMFVTRLTFDFKIAHCEPKVSDLLDYSAEELTGKNMYTLCHGEDVQKLKKCHVDLIQKGQVMSCYYRIMNKHGGFTWFQTCATVVCNAKNAEEQTIICVNYVLSGIEYQDCIMDWSQMENNSIKNEDIQGHSDSDSQDKDKKDDKDHDSKHSPKNEDDYDGSGDNKRRNQARSKKQSTSQDKGTNKNVDVDESELLDQNEMEILSEPVNYSEKDNKNSALDKHSSILGYPRNLDGNDNVMSHRKSDNSHKRKLHSDDGAGDSTPESVLDMSSRSNVDHDIMSYENGAKKTVLSPEGTSRLSASEISPKSDSVPSDSSEHERNWKKTYNSYSTSVVGSSSVKDLEDAMNKHLPLLSKDPEQSRVSFHSSELSRQSMASLQKQRSTIQWIGTQQTTAPAGATLPASTLLRQLYANRESVIRSNVHATRPTYYPDMQGTLPTPPGCEGYPEQSQFVIPPKISTHPSDTYTVMSGFVTTPVTLSNYTDSYSMTPPSSVSPREKLHAPFVDNGPFADAGTAHLRHYAAESGSTHVQPLPLKPQVYVHPGSGITSLEAVQYSVPPTVSPEQQQLYAHTTGFHIYHPTANKAASAVTGAYSTVKNGASWYNQPTS